MTSDLDERVARVLARYTGEEHAELLGHSLRKEVM
jgi:ubiquinone biosynthesis protein UbiJ